MKLKKDSYEKNIALLLISMLMLLMHACTRRDSTRMGNNKEYPESDHLHADSPVSVLKKPGMETSPAYAADTSLRSVTVATNQMIMSDQVSLPVRRIDTIIRLKGYGYVQWDIRRNKKIAARSGGRIEKLFVKYNYQHVGKGQKILELYTPEISTYAAEYLHHLVTPGDEELLKKSKEKLKLLGVTGQQLRELEKTRSVSNKLTIYSPSGGYALFEANNSPMVTSMSTEGPSGDIMTGGMGEGNNPSQTAFSGAAATTQLHEGMYVNRNQTLFYINDFEIVWGVLSFDENALPLLRVGMNLVIKSELLDLPVRSVISFIEPSYNSRRQKFTQVRANVINVNRKLRINSLVEGAVDVPLKRRLIIPASSVLSMGKRKIVWVKTGTTPSGKNIFTAREVQISFLYGEIAIVAGGLSISDEVATDAGYLLDSQSFIEP